MKYFILATLFSLPVIAKTYIIAVDKALAYDAPREGAQAVGHVGKGKKVNSTGETEGYIQVQTKSGRTMWIRMLDLEEIQSTPPSEVAQESPPKEAAPSESWDIHITWDLGVAGGSYRGETYNEVDVGVNTYFKQWLIWRNAGFMRFVQPKNYYGLDSGLRFVYEPKFIPGLGITLYGGPGYRILFSGVDGAGNSAPFGEGGLVLHIGSFHIGGGIKTVFQSVIDKNAGDDTQFFITVSGGGVIE